MNIAEVIRERGPLTVAAFMDLALYHPRLGYYARAARRSGRAGDFLTSVDVGSLFGELLAVQIAEMAAHLDASVPFDLVEAGAGTGQLAADILSAFAEHNQALLDRTRLHLVEASGAARTAQAGTLAGFASRVASSSASLPASFEGVVVANELIDAFPVHQVVMRGGHLREVYVRSDGEQLEPSEGPLSTPALLDYFDELNLTLEEGCRAEVNLAAREWIRAVAARLRRGFVLLLDYGCPAAALYSAARPDGTLSAYRRHTMRGPGDSPSGAPAWVTMPGGQDLTTHVDFTTVQRTAEAAGLVTVGLVDQTYFLLGLIDATDLVGSSESTAATRRRLAFKTLVMPGGLGSTIKVIAFRKGLDRPSLRGFPAHGRIT